MNRAAATPGAPLRTRWLAVLLMLVMAVPLLWPAIPPLADMPGHIGRYRIALGDSATLARFYSYDWRIVPNLGVDLLVHPLARIIGVEAAAKLVTLAIPVIGTAGMIALVRVVHGRISAGLLFALPLLYGWPFQLGFVNYCLGMALALCALALWLAMAPGARRAMIFALIACALWVAHAFAWGAFGLWAFASDAARRRHAGDPLTSAIASAAIACLPLLLPLVLTLLTGGGAAALAPAEWFNWPLKAVSLASALRDHWAWLDLASVALLLALIYVALRATALDARLGWPALLSLIAFLALPDKLMGGDFVEMRLAPYLLALALLAIRPGALPIPERRLIQAGGAFLGLRVLATTISLIGHGRAQAAELVALDHVPLGARVLAIAAVPCIDRHWDGNRFNHLGAMVIARRQGFTNDQWAHAGQQGLIVHYPAAAPFDRSPSEIVYTGCGAAGEALFGQHLAAFPRGAFDYAWTIGFPPRTPADPMLVPVWTNGGSTLYRIAR